MRRYDAKARHPWLEWAPRAGLLLTVALLSLAACDDGPAGLDGGEEVDGDAVCDLNQDLLWSSLPPDQIPALTEPTMVAPDHASAAYVRPGDRVLGVVVDGEARAYPHNILWHHEIVNDRIGDRWVTVTFCPLTGSGLAFDPTSVDGSPIDFGVSGLLFANNLVMYDRGTGQVFGPQLSATGKCSGFKGDRLEVLPVFETSWARWLELHPETRVVSDETGHSRNYQFYPYQSYDELTNDDLLFPFPVNTQRPIKERVLTIRRDDTGGRGYPFGELADLGSTSTVNEVVDGTAMVVLYEASSGGTAMAYEAPVVGGEALTFQPDGGGTFVDEQTGTRWNIEGLALEGELAGTELTPAHDSYVLFWFAFKHFQPNSSTFGM